MAFLKNNKYIKLLEDGTYKVYPSQEVRDRQKNATNPEIILQKYKELIDAIEGQLQEFVSSLGYSEEELQNPDLCAEIMALPSIVNYEAQLTPLCTEIWEYENDLRLEQGAQHEFPIMSEFYPDIKDSIPVVLESASSLWKSHTLADLYEEAKAKRRFGETEDC